MKTIEPVEPYLDQWAVCPSCGYENILELAIYLPHEDNWMPKFCPNCGQEFAYGDDWKDESGRYSTDEQIPMIHHVLAKDIKNMCDACLESIEERAIYTADEMGDLARDIIGTLEGNK